MKHANGRIGGPCIPTVCPVNNFNPPADVDVLYKAMKGLGTDENAITDLLTKRSHRQRMEIASAYESIKSHNLLKELISETSGDYRSILKALTTNRLEFAAKCFSKVLKGKKANDKALTDLMFSYEEDELQAIINTYNTQYGKSLIDDVKNSTSGDYRELLLSYLRFSRESLSNDEKNQAVRDSPSAVTDWDLADSDAHVIQNCFVDSNKDYRNLISTVCIRNKIQLKAILDTYRQVFGVDLIRQIEKDLPKDLGYGLRSTIISQISKPRYFSEQLYNSMKGLGTREAALIRIVVARSDIDLECIKQEYTKLYNKSLYSVIKSETSGDFGRAILALCGSN